MNNEPVFLWCPAKPGLVGRLQPVGDFENKTGAAVKATVWVMPEDLACVVKERKPGSRRWRRDFRRTAVAMKKMQPKPPLFRLRLRYVPPDPWQHRTLRIDVWAFRHPRARRWAIHTYRFFPNDWSKNP